MLTRRSEQQKDWDNDNAYVVAPNSITSINLIKRECPRSRNIKRTHEEAVGHQAQTFLSVCMADSARWTGGSLIRDEEEIVRVIENGELIAYTDCAGRRRP